MAAARMRTVRRVPFMGLLLDLRLKNLLHAAGGLFNNLASEIELLTGVADLGLQREELGRGERLPGLREREDLVQTRLRSAHLVQDFAGLFELRLLRSVH